MSGLLSGLESVGFYDCNKINLYNDEDVYKPKMSVFEGFNPDDFVYEKEITCPVCEEKFKTTVMKTKRAKLEGIDTDLRQRYNSLEPNSFDVAVCTECGYASLISSMPKISEVQKKFIRDNVTTNYRKVEYPMVYNMDMVIQRYKMAMYSAYHKKAPDSEKGFLCLRLAWIYRGLEEPNNERKYLEQAYKGLTLAYANEDFPIFGMDQDLINYLIGELARRLGNLEDAKRRIGMLIVSRDINPRLKARVQEVRQLIIEDTKKLENAEKS